MARSVARLLDLFSVRSVQACQPSIVYPVKLFEYHIRIVGGLLGAFHVSGRRELLHAATRAADVVLHAMGPLGPDASSVGRGSSADSLAGRLPRKHVRLAHQRATPLLSLLASLLDGWRATSDSVVWCNSLAGLGTFGLELRVLTRETGDPRFRDAAEKIHAEIDQRWRQNERNRTLSQGQHATVDEHREPQGDVEAPGGADGNQAPRVNGFHQNSFFLPPNLEHAWALPWMRRVGLATGDADKYAADPESSIFHCEWNGARVGFGSGGDSYYEYLLKESLVEFQPAARARLVRRYRAMLATSFQEDSPVLSGSWRDAGEGASAEVSVVKYKPCEPPTPWLFRGRYVCAWGGGKLAGKESDNGGDGERGTFAKRRGSGRPHNPDTPALSKGGTYLDGVAKSVTEHCVDSYRINPTGLAGDESEIDPETGKVMHAKENVNKLRPETVESLLVLFRTTGEPKYREMGWEIFQAFQKHCRVNNGERRAGGGVRGGVRGEGGAGYSYSGLKDVTSTSDKPELDDYMPSYFMAETLKYLYLLFAFDANGEAVVGKDGQTEWKGSRQLVSTLETPPFGQMGVQHGGAPFLNLSAVPNAAQRGAPLLRACPPAVLLPWDVLIVVSATVLLLGCCFFRAAVAAETMPRTPRTRSCLQVRVSGVVSAHPCFCVATRTAARACAAGGGGLHRGGHRDREVVCACV